MLKNEEAPESIVLML